jgi:tryptophanyl-tRNA synthetase
MSKRMLSGMQPSGRLHLGNYEGALKQWVPMQDEYEMYCCIVDWHSLTTGFDDTDGLDDRIVQMAIDYLASGLDPERCTIFVQSSVKEHAELHLLFSMIMSVPSLERLPSYKAKREELNIDSYGFLGYPLLQAADILIYRAHVVPVGEDQVRHIVYSREVARRFNALYGEVFPEPEWLVNETKVLPGTDGRKMSKSYDNEIALSDDDETVRRKVMSMFTDPEKIKVTDKGHPDRCPVCQLHRIYNPSYEEQAEKCAAGDPSWGCVASKKLLVEKLLDALSDVRAARRDWENRVGDVRDILHAGGLRATEEARKTMAVVREAMNLREY